MDEDAGIRTRSSVIWPWGPSPLPASQACRCKGWVPPFIATAVFRLITCIYSVIAVFHRGSRMLTGPSVFMPFTRGSVGRIACWCPTLQDGRVFTPSPINLAEILDSIPLNRDPFSPVKSSIRSISDKEKRRSRQVIEVLISGWSPPIRTCRGSPCTSSFGLPFSFPLSFSFSFAGSRNRLSPNGRALVCSFRSRGSSFSGPLGCAFRPFSKWVR